MLSRHPRSTLFPYTTPFRSTASGSSACRLPISGFLAAPSPKETPQGSSPLLLIFRFTRLEAVEGRLSIRRSEEHTSELQSLTNLVCRLLLEKKNQTYKNTCS